MVFGQSQLISCTSITVPKDHQPFIHIHKILKTQDKQTTFFFFQPTRHYWPPKPPTQSKPATKAPTSLLIRQNKSTRKLREFNISTIKKKNLKSPKLQKPKNFQKEREPNEALRKTQKKQCSSISLALGRRFLSLEISGRRRRRKKEEEEEVKASGNLGFVSFFFWGGEFLGFWFGGIFDLWNGVFFFCCWRRTKAMESVPSNTHGGLDEQISQLMQCKPLSEQEVLLLLHLIIHYPDFFWKFFGSFVCLIGLCFVAREMADRVWFVRVLLRVRSRSFENL